MNCRLSHQAGGGFSLRHRFALCSLTVLLPLLALMTAGQPPSLKRTLAAKPVDFNRDIRPYLDTCFACHGPMSRINRPAGADTRRAFADRGGYQVIVPGSGRVADSSERKGKSLRIRHTSRP
jgi:hypothetical protein